MLSSDGTLPAAFCWTKFGVEAGDGIAEIRARKERERRDGGGVFYWGIGNSVAPSLRLLTSACATPEVLFTPMLSSPAPADVSPQRVLAWRGGEGLDGLQHDLRSGVVTSRAPHGARPLRHFALVCASDDDLETDCSPVYFDPDCVVNLRTGARVGASQVTSIVRRERHPLATSHGRYRVAFRARLVPPYFVVLRDLDLGLPLAASGRASRVVPLELELDGAATEVACTPVG